MTALASNQTLHHLVVSTGNQIEAGYYIFFVSIVILYYDYALTFGEEVRFFWGRRINSVTVLFFLNRYLSIFGTIPIVLQNFGDLSSQKYHQFFAVVVQIIVGIIAIIRTYAIYERRPKIGLLLIATALAVISIGVWSILSNSESVSPPFDLSFWPGCHPLIGTEAANHLAGAWSSLMFFDSVIFILTVHKAIGIWRLGTRRLTHVLLRDGAIYYFVLAMANLSNILTFVIGGPPLRGVCTTFANVVSVTMIGRLMLNLQNPAIFSPSFRSDTTATRSRSRGSGLTSTQLGPFVTTVVIPGASFGANSIVTGPDLSIISRGRSDADAELSGSGGFSGEEDWYEDGYLGYAGGDGRGPRRRALWYDREMMMGTRTTDLERAESATHVEGGVTEIGAY